jgi:hypothetical protein
MARHVRLDANIAAYCEYQAKELASCDGALFPNFVLTPSLQARNAPSPLQYRLHVLNE